jgi:hypothetical protein
MVNAKHYVPKKGDVVSVASLDDANFKVVAINSDWRTVNLRKLGADHIITDIPWVALTLLERKKVGKREDFSQAAVRIVSGASEK